jgi:hypothetical protein
MTWFRHDDDDLNDPRLLRLSDKLFRVWIGLNCCTSKCGGTLPSMEDCAVMLRKQPERMAEALVSLVSAALLVRDDDGKLAPHNWKERQFQSDVSTER